MTTILPPDILPRARQIIQPLAATEDEREALLTEAFYLHNPLLYGIDRSGAPKVFSIRCIKRLLDHGCLVEGEHSLARLLSTARYDCGIDKHPEIDELVALANAICTEPPPAKAAVPLATPAVPSETSTPLSIHTPKEERQPSVFISYSHEDADFANRLIADLQAAGHACWIDTVKIKGGDEWVRSITEGINNSYAFISIVSADANESTWVRREFLWAEYKKKPIFPVMAVNCELVIYLMERQITFMYDDAAQGYSYVSGLADLRAALPTPSAPGTDELDGESVTILTRSELPPPNRRRLELDYLEWLRAEALFDLEKYTPLGGESQFMVEVRRGESVKLALMRPEFEHLRTTSDQHEETRRFENAVDEILQIKRAVLLGEPGGGKTTTLLSLAGTLAATAQNDPRAPLPLFLRLGRWTDPEQSLFDFIASELGALGGHLQSLLDENRAVPLLDGMNEIPVSQRGAKYPQIEAFIKGNPDWVAVASCRSQDYTVDLGLDRITVTPLDPLRMREFVTRYLGPDEGETLFWKIAGEAARRFEARFAERFAERLADWPTVFWCHAALPDGLAWKSENVNTFWYGWAEWRTIRDQPGSLMTLSQNPYMLSMLTQVYVEQGDLPHNRGELFADFVETLLLREKLAHKDKASGQIILTNEAQPLLDALAALAYAMQVQRGLADDKGNALTVLPLNKAREFLDPRQIYLAGSTSVLDIGEGVRFTHQLLQEYFAAVRLNNLIFSAEQPLDAGSIWQAEQWWQRTNWEEAVILLAGLYSDDCTSVVEWVNRANPEVAALCVTRSGAGLAEATATRLRQEWLPRLTALKNDPNPHARAAVGRALGLTNWDNRKGVGVIPSPLAPLPQGEGKRGRGLRGEGLLLPDIDWVTIPAGEFIYGGDDEAYKAGERQVLTLPTFSISRYPVTYAQFQAFIDDPEGFYDLRWWQGLAIPDGHNDAPGDQRFKYWNHPRERVSWYDAMAFCRWFSWRLLTVTPQPPLPQASEGVLTLENFDLMNPDTWPVRLPTEQEWEKAARGTDGRAYPYAGAFDAAKGNTMATGIGQTSAVGIFPSGASPDGVLDMSGNVWEWCLTDYRNPQERAADENISSNTPRVLRGGSWLPNQDFARAASRNNDDPGNRNFNYGFRVCASPFSL